MIAYETLVAALASWRARKGLPTAAPSASAPPPSWSAGAAATAAVPRAAAPAPAAAQQAAWAAPAPAAVPQWAAAAGSAPVAQRVPAPLPAAGEDEVEDLSEDSGLYEALEEEGATEAGELVVPAGPGPTTDPIGRGVGEATMETEGLYGYEGEGDDGADYVMPFGAGDEADADLHDGGAPDESTVVAPNQGDSGPARPGGRPGK